MTVDVNQGKRGDALSPFVIRHSSFVIPAKRVLRLVVSIHDVSPRTWPVVSAMLADLRAWGVGQTSLLVIPDHHRRGHFRDDPAFCRALERLAAQGHELVVHGYFHQRPARPAESAVTRWVTGTYTAGEGEFYDLEEPVAAERLARAQADFAMLDAPAPVGFIAPAWLLGPAAERAVRAAGFRYTTRLGTVTDYHAANGGGQTIRSQSLVWSPRNAWRRVVSLGWNAVLAQRLRNRALLRVGVHPPDRSHPALWRQVERLVRAALRDGRTPATYAEFVNG